MDIIALETHISFEAIFRQHYERLCSYAYTFLKDEARSEDVVQEVFIKIWEQRKNLIGSNQLKFYLFTAVRNNCLTAIAKNKKNIIIELGDEEFPDEITITMEAASSGADPKILLAKAMEQLPPKCREVFMLSRLSGQTYQQIADSLGISVKTVENQMGKAIKTLKVFAKENRIYLLVFCCLACRKDLMHSIGVFIEKWF
ncbi:RNA polymerase sigma-70 factor [Flavisolibacter nicotianae]|uniref:RNA polymerase sigma-70 factor n=1 Tax=Flavisolibacter nicotianae TaxID=2364882 RepID=UPI000EAF1A73|nr:RNA polymerase sigma-70 factor [Flavisolibacter nicotianae]